MIGHYRRSVASFPGLPHRPQGEGVGTRLGGVLTAKSMLDESIKAHVESLENARFSSLDLEQRKYHN